MTSDPCPRGGNRAPIALVERALADVLQRNRAFGAEQTHRDLGLTHLEGEEQSRQVVPDGCGACHIESER